ncbi:hypothetical protein PGQ11_008462 [Apiospora arundinis]|uniref:Uncharacterized protein n=1 Tax=Apiospora arundinis TaxID=335852 RepID=A0ABR2IFW0_9PEZI
MANNGALPEGSPYLHPEFSFTEQTENLAEDLVVRPGSIFVGEHWSQAEIVQRRMEVLVELVCRLGHYSSVKHFWHVVVKTWLEQSNVTTQDIRRTIQLITAYRMGRLRYRTKYLAEHGMLPKAKRGLTKAMDWWIGLVGENAQAEYGFKSNNPNKESAIRALDRLVSHYRVQIALRPILVFHHAPWVPAYESWNKSPEMKGFPEPFGIQPPRISKRGEAFLAAMRTSFKETEEEAREGMAADLRLLSLNNNKKTAETPALPENCSVLEYEIMVEASAIEKELAAIEKELAALNTHKEMLEQRLANKRSAMAQIRGEVGPHDT